MSNEFLHLSPDEKRNKEANDAKSNKESLTGWTPLVLKTYFNEQLYLFNSTPNKNFLPQEVDYSQGFNLTPFLSHNINAFPGNVHGSATFNSIQHQLSNITPFHDKTLHLADFFMDSPIRGTPMKEADTITPSKFRLGSEKTLKTLALLVLGNSGSKRSITALDTPLRQPHKLSISTAAKSQDDDKENADSKKLYLQTPSRKALVDVTNRSPKRINTFQTPAKQIPDSSPSTVIMSSAAREAADTDDEEDDDKKIPGSPTPSKTVLTDENKPAMGVFQENKKRLKPKPGNAFRTTSMGQGKGRMQAGMNKFQIVFTDVHALANKQNKKLKRRGTENKDDTRTSNNPQIGNSQIANAQVGNIPSDGNVRGNIQNSVHGIQNPGNSQHSGGQGGQSAPHSGYPMATAQPTAGPSHVLVNSSHIANSSMNNSNVMNSTMNTTNTSNMMNTSTHNLSTDHSSFELGGALLTPNSKYLLDREKPSPQANNSFFLPLYMPPPRTAPHSDKPMMVMVMSTPQHQNVLNYPYDISPDDQYSYQKGAMMPPQRKEEK